MSSNAQKTPLARTLNRFAEKKALDALQIQGKSLPCSVVSVSGQIVTVKFEVQSGFTLPNVKVPIATSTYIRLPVQVGDLGLVMPADARLGGVSGLGSGTAGLSQPGNLSALIFVPIANKGWAAASNANALDLNGPQGVVIHDTANNSTITVNSTGITVNGKTSLTLEVGSTSIVINASGITINGNINQTGNYVMSGNVQVDGTSDLKGAVTAENTLDVDGATTLHSTLDVKSAAILESTLDVKSAATLENSLTVDGTTDLISGVHMQSTLQVDGGSTLSGAVTAQSTLAVDGGFHVVGTSQFDQAINASSNFTVAGTATFNGPAIANDNLTVAGNITATGDVTAGFGGGGFVTMFFHFHTASGTATSAPVGGH